MSTSRKSGNLGSQNVNLSEYKLFFPNPVQKQFIESRGIADVFISRLGEGKTTALVFACYYHCLLNPGANWAIIRETWESLHQTTMYEFMRWFGDFVDFYKEHRVAIWKPPMKGRVWFVPADEPRDANRLQSRELAGIAIDEVVPVGKKGGVSETIFDIALGRRRQPGVKWYALKLACNNPPTTHWVYRRFIENPVEGFNVFQTQAPENLNNLREGYYEELLKVWAHRRDLIKRYVAGEYCAVFEGSPLAKEFDPKRHVLEPPELDPSKEVIAMWDPGVNSALLIGQMRNGKLCVYQEFFTDSAGVFELIEGLEPKWFSYRYLHIGDPAMTFRNSVRVYNAGYPNCPANIVTRLLGGKFIPGAQDLETRIDVVNMCLKDNEVIISPNCRFLIEALSGGWSTEDIRVQGKKSHPFSDLADALCYGLSVLFANKLYQHKSTIGKRIVKPVYSFQ